MKPLQGKTALVTGGSRGIGKAICLKLARQGASLVVNYVQQSEQADDVVARINGAGGNAIAVKADMRDVLEVGYLFDVTLEQYGSLDILVNNAGVVNYKPIEEFTEQEFDDIFAVNVKGVFFACQQAARKMTDGGSIINMSSSVTRLILPSYGAYGATKGAVEQITKVLAKELGGRHIRVNALSPGPVDTSLFRAGKTQEQVRQLAEMAALGRIGTVEDIADIVAFLASEESAWITGQNIGANGGFTG